MGLPKNEFEKTPKISFLVSLRFLSFSPWAKKTENTKIKKKSLPQKRERKGHQTLLFENTKV